MIYLWDKSREEGSKINAKRGFQLKYRKQELVKIWGHQWCAYAGINTRHPFPLMTAKVMLLTSLKCHLLTMWPWHAFRCLNSASSFAQWWYPCTSHLKGSNPA